MMYKGEETMDVKSKVQEIFREVFEDDTLIIREDMAAADIEDWDSLAHIELIVSTEKAFQVKFSTPEIAALNNIGDFISLINRKLEG